MSAFDTGIVVLFMGVTFCLTAWMIVATARHYDQYGLKAFFWVWLVWAAACAGEIYAADAITGGAIHPAYYALCAGVAFAYTTVGAAVVAKPVPMKPAALWPTHVSVALGATHGLVITARGRKSDAALAARFVTDDVRLYVEGDALWRALGTFVSSSLLSMAQMTILPVQLVPMYLPAGALKPADGADFHLTVSLGTKTNGQKGLGHATLRTNLQKLVAAGDPPIFLRFFTPPDQPLFILEVKPSELLQAVDGPDRNLNLWRAAGPHPAGPAVGPQVDVKQPDAVAAVAVAGAGHAGPADAKLPDPSAPPASAGAQSPATAAAAAGAAHNVSAPAPVPVPVPVPAVGVTVALLPLSGAASDVPASGEQPRHSVDTSLLSPALMTPVGAAPAMELTALGAAPSAFAGAGAPVDAPGIARADSLAESPHAPGSL